jgi:hypothetical protein
MSAGSCSVDKMQCIDGIVRSVVRYLGLDLISTRMDLPMDQDDARVGRIASLDVVHVDARRDFGRIVLEAHDDEMSYERYWLYATQCRDVERLLRS